ncbi:GNAT family N-acetyltransferase [Streptomyces europaeiscabiei]|uniref:GNAT family N-acetyltransferase n=1 Tax=Streptomyces europaeiscabiei TaxID=146819 RepID=UPI0029A2FDBC|nr:GNAT family N-acetyltransferase [Streptomyces europaeiscabiei]MDX3694847.1 GNAT family N-acetyltransferase [Streptomyces europaeiscabiei]
MPPPQTQQPPPTAVLAYATRPAVPEDLPAINALHGRCSLATRFARYQCARSSLKESEYQHLLDAGSTWVTTPADSDEVVIAVTHLLHTSTPAVRELALLIDEAWQGQRLGGRLADLALDAARADPSCRAVSVLTGATNRRMLRILRRRGAVIPPAHGPTLDITLTVER